MSQFPEIPEIKDATPEQRKQISKVLLKAKLSLIAIAAKTGFFLFLANFISIGIGTFVLMDTDPQMQMGFHLAAIFINTIFLLNYFTGQTKKHSDIVLGKIQEILKNK